jgi:hypothetical protein
MTGGKHPPSNDPMTTARINTLLHTDCAFVIRNSSFVIL